MEGKHSNNKIKKGMREKSKLVTALYFVFIFIMVFSGMRIAIWIKENKENNDIIKDIQSKAIADGSGTLSNIDFKGLKQINSDVIAYLKVNGTNIEYPVVKTTNNDYYMTHSFNKTSNSAGWVFMNCNNRFDGTDNNLVIFAHNRRDGSMFGTLKNILTNEWQSDENNLIIPFITENKKEEYEVFSVYKIEKEDYYITTNFDNDEEFQKFINTIKSRSEADFKTDVTTKDHILTLSTCADNNQFRVVLHAKKIE